MLKQTIEVQVRYCEDCRFYRKGDKCAHPMTRIENQVKRSAAEAYCGNARSDYGSATTCGPGARYFRESEKVSMPIRTKSLWKRLWSLS